jgi:hypothetical protein
MLPRTGPDPEIYENKISRSDPVLVLRRHHNSKEAVKNRCDSAVIAAIVINEKGQA